MIKKILTFKSPWDDDGNIFSNKTKSNFEDKLKQLNLNFKDGNKILVVFIATILIFWLLSGFYQLKEGEEALVLRFGSINRIATAGLNYKLPSPIEEVIVEQVSQSKRLEIGYRSNGKRTKLNKIIPTESRMLTGDENIVELTCDVVWHIKDLSSYFLYVTNQSLTIKEVSESALREVIGRKKITAILSNKKQEIAQEIETLIQKISDFYQLGIKIDQVQLLKAEPPSEVIDAYRDVQTARADKERSINQAQSYWNDVLPKAKGEAARLNQEATGYKNERIAVAKGDTARFKAILSEYTNNKSITKKRLYLETMEHILINSQKVINSQGVFPHMSINRNNQ